MIGRKYLFFIVEVLGCRAGVCLLYSPCAAAKGKVGEGLCLKLSSRSLKALVLFTLE